MEVLGVEPKVLVGCRMSLVGTEREVQLDDSLEPVSYNRCRNRPAITPEGSKTTSATSRLLDTHHLWGRVPSVNAKWQKSLKLAFHQVSSLL